MLIVPASVLAAFRMDSGAAWPTNVEINRPSIPSSPNQPSGVKKQQSLGMPSQVFIAGSLFFRGRIKFISESDLRKIGLIFSGFDSCMMDEWSGKINDTPDSLTPVVLTCTILETRKKCSFSSFHEHIFVVLMERSALHTGLVVEGGLFVWSDHS